MPDIRVVDNGRHAAAKIGPDVVQGRRFKGDGQLYAAHNRCQFNIIEQEGGNQYCRLQRHPGHR